MKTHAPKTRHQKRGRHFYRNIKPAFVLLFIPLAIGFSVTAIIATGLYARNLASLGSQRLVTEGWESAQKAMLDAQPTYERKYAYYKVREGQTIEDVARYFSVEPKKLVALNPGTIVAGTTIVVPPLESPLKPSAGPNGVVKQAEVVDDQGLLRIKHKYRLKQPAVTTIPELAQFLAPYNAIELVKPGTYRINKAFSLDGDIRLDITSATLKKLELRSSPLDITCLCMDQGTAFIDGVEITTIDPTTNKPDLAVEDGRSFVRMKNGRMDVLNSTLSYLGNGLEGIQQDSKINPPQREGGVYGVSWRISDDQLGISIATGWVEKNLFTRNHFGAYSFGASGMTWRNNHFYKNDVYGLDPHDDSNNALIENNLFDYNGKHGFIVSKRCNYNIIRNNTSHANGLHGYMLHQDSAYNVIENNVSYGNEDNFAVFASNFNTVRNNLSYSPKGSHIRINQGSYNTYVTGNQLFGGKRGIYLYDNTKNTLIARNSIHDTRKQLDTRAAGNTIFADNTVDGLNYDIAPGDRIIFGTNTIDAAKSVVPQTPPLPAGYTVR